MEAPVGAPASRLKVSAYAGISESLAGAVNVRSVVSLTDCGPIGSSTGALFTSLTVTVKVRASLNAGEPLSVTRMVMLLVLGPCASLGVQLKRPLVPLMLAPEGAPASKLKLKDCAGTSESLALAVKLRRLPSLIV